MAKFKGKNSIKRVSELARQRMKYTLGAFPSNDGAGPKQVVNFNFAEKSLYGRVDQQHNAVIANQDYIVPLKLTNNKTSTIMLMNFVADQFADLEAHFVRACRLGLIPIDDPILSSLQAHRGYKDPTNLYRNYASTIMETYITNFLVPRKNQINNFHDFLHHFPEFMRRMQDIFPMSYSGFQRSSQSSIFVSGLTLDIGGIAFDNDEEKENLLFNSPAFEFYINLSKQYGFSVNKRNPGVLISDVASPVTRAYRNQYQMPTVASIFRRQFTKTLYSDVSELKKLLVNYFNFFVSNYPIQRKFKVCSGVTLSDIYRKQPINIDSINNNNIIYLYIIIRNIEERGPFSQHTLDGIYNNALRINKVSETRMLDFIDDQFKSNYNQKVGSLTYYKKKMEKRLDK